MTEPNSPVTSGSGVAIVKIDGDKIREFREKKGLTQLYVATVVEVTTDTISRWENRRYPTIKKENALKLAEALEVELSDILEEDKQSSDEENKEEFSKVSHATEISKPKYDKLIGYTLGLLLLATIVLILSSWWKSTELSETNIKAYRILPKHVAPGQTFPVIITLTAPEERKFSLILKDILPQNCTPIHSIPPFTAMDKKTGVLKWISKITGGNKKSLFSYMAQISTEATEGDILQFNGAVTLKKEKGAETLIQGDNIIKISNFHWADTNMDNKIDDEEILNVYDTFGTVRGLEFGKEGIEGIWSGKGYRWNPKSLQYEIIQ